MTTTGEKEYFDALAKKQTKRPISAYYWNEIFNYCNYFFHEDSSVLEVGCGNGELPTKIVGNKKLQNWLNSRDINNLLSFSGFDLDRNTKRLYSFYISILPTILNRFKHGVILLRMCLFASRKCKFI